MPEQKLTVSGHYRPGWSRWQSRLDQLPYLPLLGSWLREAGFEVGDRVRVREAAPGRLVVEVVADGAAGEEAAAREGGGWAAPAPEETEARRLEVAS